ncbi:NigD-like protein [uncultured Bacteroides sp.]|uniref:NigD-like protein n=1 Tax=uncultured Bacteroides sp. TaxID=162156 RepID=UPI0025F08763|nr:NigD-like protein [uncultured Bacteroides sp.]
MKKLHWLVLMMCLAVLPALQSCDDSDGYSIGDLSYPNWATVRVTGNAFYLNSDTWGTLWPINTNMGWYQPVDGQRMVTIFNPIYDNYGEYDHAVKIERIWHALTKGVEPLTAENEEEYGNDPVFIYKGDITISGGYMNIIFMQNLPKNSETKHRISLVQRAENVEVPLDDEASDDGYIHLELRYNDYDDLSGIRAAGLVSFNLKDLDITSETKGIKLKLNSEVNKEVEITFDKQPDNSDKASNLDFSKMQLK